MRRSRRSGRPRRRAEGEGADGAAQGGGCGGSRDGERRMTWRRIQLRRASWRPMRPSARRLWARMRGLMVARLRD